jgi:phenylalanine ammonia-lyase
LIAAFDLRALQADFCAGLTDVISQELDHAFGHAVSSLDLRCITQKVVAVMQDTFEKTGTMDAPDRMQKVAASSTTTLVDYLTNPDFRGLASAGTALTAIPTFRTKVASRATILLDTLRRDYLSGSRGAAPASTYLNKTRPIYEYVRLTLGIRMHGSENYAKFANELGAEDGTLGQSISLIHEVIQLLFLLICATTDPSVHRLFEMESCKELSPVCLSECSIYGLGYTASVVDRSS